MEDVDSQTAWVPKTNVENLIDHKELCVCVGGGVPSQEGGPSPGLPWLATAKAANPKDKERVFLY